MSVFLHGQMAIRSAQIEVLGQDSIMGRLVFHELETLWEIGHELNDVKNWETELEDIAATFGVAP